MKELLERLRGATGADRELDAAIGAALGVIDAARYGLAEGYRYAPLRVSEDGLKVEQWVSHDSKPEVRMFSRSPQPITASLDAALALVERVLPGWAWNVSGPDPESGLPLQCEAAIAGEAIEIDRGYGQTEWDRPFHTGHAPTAPLALLIALLGALSGRPEAEDGTVDQSNGTNNNPSLSKPNQ